VARYCLKGHLQNAPACKLPSSHSSLVTPPRHFPLSPCRPVSLVTFSLLHK
jgi:hypothetical protein